MTTEQKKAELQELAKYIQFSLTDESFANLNAKLYNSDFIIVNEEDSVIDKQIKKLIKKTGVVKDGHNGAKSEFYQLFYYFTLTFQESKKIRVILLNSEIGKFLELFKRYILENSAFSDKLVETKIREFNFVNNSFIEDYKVLNYKFNLIKVLKKYEITNKAQYKSFKHTVEGNEPSFKVLTNEEYDTMSVNNSKVNVVGGYLFMLKDLNILQDFY